MPIRTMMMQRRRGRHVDKQQNDRQQQDRSRYDNLWMDPSDQSVDAVRSAIFISSQHMGLDRHQQQHQQPPRGDRDNSHGRRRRRGSRGRRRRGRRRCRTADSDASSSIPSDENEDDTDNADNDRDFEFGFDDDYDDDVIDDGYQDHAVDGTSTADDEVGSSYKKRGRQKQQRRTGVGGELTVSDEDDDDDDSVLIDEAVNKLWPRQRAGGGDSTTVAGSSSDGTSNASPAAIISYGSRTIGNDRKVWKFLPTENSVITRMSRARSLIAKDKLSFTKLKLFGRSEETKQLEECLQRFMTIPAPAPSTDDDVNMKHASVDGILRQNSSSGRSVRPEIILLNGGAGVGKKTMADYVERRMVRKSTDGIFLCGTFKPNDLDNVQSQYGHQQLQRPPQPYSAITSACQKLCGKLLHISRSDRPRWCRLRSRLVERIGPVRVWLRTPLSTSPSSSFADNWKVLFQLLPDLEDVMTCADRTCLHVESQPKDDALLNASESPESSSQAATQLVHELFRQFIRTVISDEGLYKHIIVSFDDLQYADEDSLDLLHTMAFYKDVPILVIATYRSDEFKENPLLESFVKNIREASCPSDDTDSNSSAHLTELEITNFDTEQVREMLMIVLDYDPTPALSELAHFCYKRTRGNMKQLKIFLRNMQTKDMLTFNPIDWKWEWDLNRMISMTCAMDNVLDDLVQRLLHLPRAVQQRLSTASLLGPTFDASIESIVSNCLNQNEDESLMYKHDGWLEFVEEKEIIEPILKDDGKVEYKWTHMKLRDTSMGLIGQEEYAAFKVDVARILLNELSQEQKEEHVCMMADLLVSSKGKITSISSANIAVICCLASKKAAEKISYESMYAYATTGIRYLPDEKWNQHYQLSLDLYNFAMKSASTLGMEEEMIHFFDEIVRREEISFVDKTSAYTALIHSRSAENDVSGKMQAVRIALESLAQFGLTFPSGKIQRRMASVRLLYKLKRRLRKITPLDVVSWPAATDPVKLCVMDLLSHSTKAVFVDRDLLNLWILTLGWYALDARMMHKYLPLSFAQLGVVFSDMNDYSTASKCGELVDTLWAAFPEECGETCSETVAYSSSSIFPFSRPYHAVRKPLLEKGYANGLLLGQKSAVETCLVFYLYMSFFSSCPLRSVEADCRKYMQQGRNLSFRRGELEYEGKNIAMLFQCTLNLLGKSADGPLSLCGEVIPDFEVFQSSITIETGKCLLLMLREYLCMIFGSYIDGADLALSDEGRFKKGTTGMFFVMPETFARGVNLFAAARMTGKKRYRRAAKSVLKVTRRWAAENNPNVQHHYQLFLAEMCALDGQDEKAELLYHRALSLAKRAGFVSDAAIISERCADFYDCRKKSQDDTKYKVEEACRLYAEWGCKTKSDMLQRKYDRNFSQLPIPTTVFAETQVPRMSLLEERKSILEPRNSLLDRPLF